MNIQEREEYDYEDGCQSELQNAYEQSCHEIDTSGDDKAIQEALQQGKYVVVHWHEVYCPRTDAYIADVATLVDTCETFGDAQDIVDETLDLSEGHIYLEIKDPFQHVKITEEDDKNKRNLDNIIPF